jgi:hypothetical protein
MAYCAHKNAVYPGHHRGGLTGELAYVANRLNGAARDRCARGDS